MTEIKPTTFKQGVPKAARNGLFGTEETLIDLALAGKQVTAIVTYAIPKVNHDEVADERYPLVELVHIEPLYDEKAAAAAIKLRDAAYKSRTGENTIDFGDDD